MMDLRGWPGQKESGVLPVCQDSQEHQDFQVYQDRTDLQAPGECRAATEQKVKGVTQDLEGFLELLVYRVHPVYLVPRETQVT